MIRTEGFRGFLRGLHATIWRDTATYGKRIYFSFKDLLKRKNAVNIQIPCFDICTKVEVYINALISNGNHPLSHFLSCQRF